MSSLSAGKINLAESCDFFARTKKKTRKTEITMSIAPVKTLTVTIS